MWNEKVLQVNESAAVRSGLRLGAAVGAGGNFLLTQGAGAVYVFAKNAQGEWAQTTRLVAPGGGALTGPIAFDGTHALIRGFDAQNTSVVVHYFWDGTRWRVPGVLKGVAHFGTTIALDGCTALIASAYERDARYYVPVRARYVHHFDRCRGGTGSFTWVGSIPAASYGGGVHFGSSIALQGDNAIVGEPGRVYHFWRSGDAWTLRQTLQETEPESLPSFGYSVGFRDNLLLVAAKGTIADPGQDGLIIRYSWNGTQWVHQGRLNFPRGPDIPGYEDLGRKIVITDTKAFFTAPAIRNRITSAAMIYAFDRQGLDNLHPGPAYWLFDYDYAAGWDSVLGYRPFTFSHFSADIAITGDTLVVGSPDWAPTEKPAFTEGRTTVYTIPPRQ